MNNHTTFSSIRVKYFLTPSYPRKRSFRFSFLNKRNNTKFLRHPLFNKRERNSNTSRDTYLRYNARVHAHNKE